MRWAIAVLISSVFVFMWGFVFYDLSGVPEKVILEVDDEVQVGESLKEYFPENGVYFLPNTTHNEEESEKLHKAGPVAIVHMRRINGVEMMDKGILISGFCHIMLTCIALCMLLGVVNRGLSGWFARIGFFLLVGLLVAFYGKIGEAVWWQQSWSWQLINAMYDWVAISIAGLVISTIAPYPKK